MLYSTENGSVVFFLNVSYDLDCILYYYGYYAIYNIRCGIVMLLLFSHVLAIVCSGKYRYARRSFFRTIDTALLLFCPLAIFQHPPVTVL
jgi:hypothetical protein